MATLEQERTRLARALTGMAERAASAQAPVDHLSLSADHAERLLARFDEAPDCGALWGVASTPDGARGMIIIGGMAPPRALQRAALVGDVLEGEITFDARYEGRSGDVHGGHIALLFDELFHQAQSVTGARPAVTAHLEFDFLKPARIGVPLRFECRVVAVDGRKVTVEGTLREEETVLVKAGALFVARARDDR